VTNHNHRSLMGLAELVHKLAVRQRRRFWSCPYGAVQREELDLCLRDLPGKVCSQPALILLASLQSSIGTMPLSRKSGRAAQHGEGGNLVLQQESIQKFELGIFSAGKEVFINGLTKLGEFANLLCGVVFFFCHKKSLHRWAA